MEQIRWKSDSPKEQVLFKLLQLGPEPLPSIVRVTGWAEAEAVATLDQLIAAKRVRRTRRYRGSVALFEVIKEHMS
jgi:hypothetical protein